MRLPAALTSLHRRPGGLPRWRYPRDGAIAQLGERLHGMQEVRGSTPLGSTKSCARTSFCYKFRKLDGSIMATLHEYFIKDGSDNLTTHKTFELRQQNGEILSQPIARMHYDFNARAAYISFYIPHSSQIECPEALLLNCVQEMLTWCDTEVGVQAGFGSELQNAKDLVFTGRIYLYSEMPVKNDLKELLIKEAEEKGHSLIFRSTEYMEARNKFEKPLAFISHDSRDKELIAQPLAIHLSQKMCPVWYDEFTLKVGDSLRESIEKGLKECHKCVLIITPNFLAKGGWSKREYDSIFTRELIEDKKLILPIWHEVTKEEVFDYSPILGDRLAVHWSTGIDNVSRKIISAIGL